MALLTIGDHLVYQAYMNIVAEKIFKRLGKHYGKNIFANQFTGSSSIYFYRPWQTSYHAFSNACRRYFHDGYIWVATFDYASYYDSIDHEMLVQILVKSFYVEGELASELRKLLQKWSSATDGSLEPSRLYLGHGIPQGPAPSPMLSEAPLWYLDSEMIQLKSVRYVRYADDIRIFGRDEDDVRYASALLDRLSRHIGIFPQGKKAGIKRYDDIEELVKKVSFQGIEDEENSEAASEVLKEIGLPLNQDSVIRLLVESLESICNSSPVILDDTNFKYILGGAPANAILARLVARAMFNRIDLFESFSRYLEKCRPLDSVTVDFLLSLATTGRQYPIVVARILSMLLPQALTVKGPNRKALIALVTNRLEKKKGSLQDCVLQSQSRLMALRLGIVSVQIVETWLLDDSTSWWSKAHFISKVDETAYGRNAFIGVLRELAKSDVPEVARAAGLRLAILQQWAEGNESEDAKCILKSFGLTGSRKVSASSRIHKNLCTLLRDADIRDTLAKTDWSKMLGSEESTVERYTVQLCSYVGSDKTQLICELDAMLDIVAAAVLRLNRFTFTDRNGSVRTCQSRPQLIRNSADFQRDFPSLQVLCFTSNSLRNRCNTAHPYFTAGGGRDENRRIYFSEAVTLLRLIPAAVADMSILWPMN